MTEPLPESDSARSTRPSGREMEGKGASNLLLLAFLAAVVGIGVWLLNAMMEARKADECMTQGRRDCAPIQAPLQ